MGESNKTSGLTATVRGAFGAVFGAVLGTTSWFWDLSPAGVAVSALICAVVFAGVSVAYGDRFWDNLGRFGHWM